MGFPFFSFIVEESVNHLWTWDSVYSFSTNVTIIVEQLHYTKYCDFLIDCVEM